MPLGMGRPPKFWLKNCLAGHRNGNLLFMEIGIATSLTSLTNSREPVKSRQPRGPRRQRGSGMAVLFDCDGTLIETTASSGDPDAITPLPAAAAVLAGLRALGYRTGILKNQPEIGRGLLAWHEVEAANRRIEALLGSFDVWRICPHTRDEGCPCRIPKPGMILSAAAKLGLPPQNIIVIGTTGRDMVAAAAAGSRGILIPAASTLRADIAAAKEVAQDLHQALELIVGSRGQERALRRVSRPRPASRAAGA